MELLAVPQARYKLDLTIARGLDYYTGTVYETVLDDYPTVGSVCSGGRYDDLTSYYTSTVMPGVGASIGLTRLFDQLKAAGLIEASASTVTKVLVVPVEPRYLPEATRVAVSLRQSGVPTEVGTSGKKLGAHLKYAGRLRIPYVAIVGMEEADADQVVLKDMATSSQQIVSLDGAKIIVRES